MSIASSSSPGSIAVISGAMKKSPAGSVRDPCCERSVRVASSATAAAGSSAAGSAWAMLPPIVPRVRMARCATCPSASGRMGSVVCDLRVVLDRVLTRHGADPDRAVTALDSRELAHPAQIDDRLGARDPHAEHRDEALSAGEQARVLGPLREQTRAPRRGSPASGRRTVRTSSGCSDPGPRRRL